MPLMQNTKTTSNNRLRVVRQPLNLFPLPGHHMTVIGQTGSGKTTLVNGILQTAMSARYPVMILDTKGEKLFSSLDPFTKLKDIKRASDVIVYRPNPDELMDEQKLDEFQQMAYERDEDCIIYVDELTSLGDSPKAKRGLMSNYSRGREHLVRGKLIHTTAIGGTQAPFFLPRMVYRQSRSFAVFRLNDENDRKAVARSTHPHMKMNAEDDQRMLRNKNRRYAFWYFRNNDREPYPLVMKLQ